MTKLTPEQRKFADNHEFSDDELNVISYIDTQLAIKGNYLNYMDIVDALAYRLLGHVTGAKDGL